MDTVKIQVLFSEETKYGTFTDALYFTQQEYAALTPLDIKQMEQQRIDNYVSSIDNAPPEKDLTKKELQLAIANLDIERAFFQAKLDLLT